MLVLPQNFARGDLDGVPLRQAKNYTRAVRRRGDVLWVVIHTAECAEVVNAAENLAAWAAGPQAPRASWHYCLTPSMRVLHSDLIWRPIGELQEGDELLATQEEGQGRSSRSLLDAKVTNVRRRRAPCVRVDFSDGRWVTCSRDHKWLAMNRRREAFNWQSSWQWMAAEGLAPNDAVCAPLTPWDQNHDHDWGYVGGVFDGEGCWHTASTAQIEFSQKTNVVLRRMHEILNRKGVDFNVQARPNGVNVTLISGLSSTLRLISQSRPERLMKERRWLGRSLKSRAYDNKVYVEYVEDVGEQEVVSVETTERTFFAEGLVSHNCVDSNSITQSVLEHDVAWHAPGANAAGIGVECAGRAGQTESQWSDLYSQAMLAKCARLIAGICERWEIPVQRLGPSHLRARTPGITGHADVSNAFKKSTHTDPGAHFPWVEFLEEVDRVARRSTPSPSSPSSPRIA